MHPATSDQVATDGEEAAYGEAADADVQHGDLVAQTGQARAMVHDDEGREHEPQKVQPVVMQVEPSLQGVSIRSPLAMTRHCSNVASRPRQPQHNVCPSRLGSRSGRKTVAADTMDPIYPERADADEDCYRQELHQMDGGTSCTWLSSRSHP